MFKFVPHINFKIVLEGIFRQKQSINKIFYKNTSTIELIGFSDLLESSKTKMLFFLKKQTLYVPFITK